MTKKNKRIEFQLFFNKKYLAKLFEEKLSHMLGKVNEIEIYNIKRYNRVDFQHCVNCYAVHGLDKVGKKTVLKIFVSAHSDGSRKKSFEMMKFLNNSFLECPNLGTPIPLFYSKKLKASFHLGFEGDNLYDLCERHSKSIKRYLKLIAHWLAVLHQLRPPKNISRIRIDLDFFDPSGILDKVKDPYIPFKKRILELIDIINQYWKKELSHHSRLVLSHGDVNLENIIFFPETTKPKDVAIIDYTDIGLADCTFDLGHFRHRLRGMLVLYLKNKEEKVKKLNDYFLKCYLRTVKKKKKKELMNHLVYFEAVASLKLMIYGLYLKRSRRRLTFHLKSCENRLKQLDLI